MIIQDKKALKKVNEILLLDEQCGGRLITAVDQYIKLKTRNLNPDGRFDSKGRWYPSVYYSCCRNICSPTKKFPYSLNTHCRSAEHISTVYEISKSDLVKSYNFIKKYYDTEENIKVGYLLSKFVNDTIEAVIILPDEDDISDFNCDCALAF